MTPKGDLDALVKRCRAVVDDEIALLQRWEADTGLEHGRRASCGLARRSVQDRRQDIEEIVEAVNDLDEGAVIASPGPVRRGEAAAVEASFRARANSRGSDLSDEEFEDALSTAKENAASAADTAKGTLADCTAR